MRSFHTFRSTVAPAGNPGDVNTQNWNDIETVGASESVYSASGNVPTAVDYMRCIGGAGGIALVLTPGSAIVTGPSGSFVVCQVYRAKKVDTGAGAITFTSLNGETFGASASASYALTQQGQWVEFVYVPPTGGGVGSWDVFGGMES